MRTLREEIDNQKAIAKNYEHDSWRWEQAADSLTGDKQMKACFQSVECEVCANEHMQIAKWLEELETRRQAPASTRKIRKARYRTSPGLADANCYLTGYKNGQSEATKHSRWLAKDFHSVYCDNCWFTFDIMTCDFVDSMFFCPKCGARMKRGEEQNDSN